MKTSQSTAFRLGALLTGLAFAAAIVVVSLLSDHQHAVATTLAQVDDKPSSPVRFTSEGELVQPTGYRKWPYVGTPLTPNDMNDGKAAFPEFHNVYVDPTAFDSYEKTGEFPDGTVVIKELLSVGTKKASSGKGYFMGEFTGLEVSIKDKSRFKDEPGNWAFFSFGHEYPLAATAAPQPAANCAACHGNLADEDYVFTQYYPVLRAAKPTK